MSAYGNKIFFIDKSVYDSFNSLSLFKNQALIPKHLD